VPDFVADGLLANIASKLSTVSAQINALSANVQTIERSNAGLQMQLASLIADFNHFQQRDEAHKEVALSETRLVQVRQELESRFGYYAEIRRRAKGILQASDLAIVRKETMRSATEETMLNAPEYWLAPALVALSAWIGDNRELGERALLEAMRRDDCKTSLLMTLVCRRLGRHDVSRAWLVRYFALQDPFALDRDVIVLVDALANGVFGAASMAKSLEAIDGWLKEIVNRVGVVEEQRTRWNAALRGMKPSAPQSRYTYLEKYSPTWPHIREGLLGVGINREFGDKVEQTFSGEIVLSPRLVERVDGLVESLVKNFDDAELPLREQERRLQLVIRSGGDRASADAQFAVEAQVFQEQSSFIAVLTNAALGIGVADLSRATQRLAFALSVSWIIEAYDDVVADVRAKQPGTIDLRIEDWSGVTTDGSNETALLEDLKTRIDAEERAQFAKFNGVRFWWPSIVAGVCVFFALLMFPLAAFWLFIALLFGGGQAIAYFTRNGQIQRLQSHFASKREAGASIVKALCAEVVDMREEIAREDGRAESVRTRLVQVRSGEYLGASAEPGRRIVA
jgi:hypothetical protein